MELNPDFIQHVDVESLLTLFVENYLSTLCSFVYKLDISTKNVVQVKVPISSQFLFSHLILYFMQWTSAKKIFDLDKRAIFFMKF